MGKTKRVSGSSIIPLFIEKLTNILEDQLCSEYIDWTSTQDAFTIKDVNRFTDTVLPKYFKHNNFSSFIRQLNMYGFNKIRHEQGENVYKNENFKRHNQLLLKNIKRKINQNEKEDKLVLYQPATSLNKQLNELRMRQKNLQGMCKQLITQNNKILEENNMMMGKLSQEQKEKNSKMEQLLVSLIMARGNTQVSLPSSEDGRMLSITNQQNNDDYNQVNNSLAGFREFLEDQNGVSKLQQALKNFQSQQRKKNKVKSYSILGPQNMMNSQEVEAKMQVEPDSQNYVQPSQGVQENQLLSLSDFLNIDSPHGPEEPLI